MAEERQVLLPWPSHPNSVNPIRLIIITQSKTELPEYNSLEIYEEYRRYLAI